MRMLLVLGLGFIALSAAQHTLAAQLNLAALSCLKYENVVLAPPAEVVTTPAAGATDPIDTVMWLFGLSVARSGQHAMYGNSLPAFGFALDAQCKSNPTSSLLDAVSNVSSKRDNPMDLTTLSCGTFESRHAESQKSDPESAKTLAMWLFGYAVGLAGGHVFDSDALSKFETGLRDHCDRYPHDSLYDALDAPNPAIPVAPGKSPPRAARP